jgi:ribosomal small subunit protein bTHX
VVLYYLCTSFQKFFTKIVLVKMGKGDPRTKKGKIIRGSHGNSRPKLKKYADAKKKQSA